jgi:hypothetical protein
VICGDFQAGYVIADIGQPFFVTDTVTSKGNTLFYVERRLSSYLPTARTSGAGTQDTRTARL